ncbi:MAG: hypothetical protein FWH34_03565 [Desulfovibrionaceae bacterium]|nr:hypothetical protein [Desulfovibrionaceae bacterium]
MCNYAQRYRLIMQICILFFVLLSVSACSLRPVRVVQERQFQIMCAQLRPEMTRRALLDEQGNYLSSPLLPWASHKNYGNALFRHLSPAFRYNADNPMAAPKTFAESAASTREVHIRDYGFTLKQGLDTVDLNLIAQSDWEGNGQKEWLLSCKVTSGGAPVSRTYYLALPDLEAEGTLNARALAVFECMGYDCTLYLPNAGKPAYAPESPIIESLPGQRAITSPPANPPAPPAIKAHTPSVPKKRSP